MGFFYADSFAILHLISLTFSGIILFQIIHGIRLWSKNNNAPQLTAEAEVISKHTSISSHSTPTATFTNTSHYAIFQVGCNRLEFHVSAKEYSLLTKGDHGQLTFQGTRFLSFTRC